jgi:hypothetical protein
MTHVITASWDVLLRQASSTADTYLVNAIHATENLPEGVDRTAIIVAFMQAAASDFRSASISVAAQTLANELSVIGARE